MWEGPRSNPGPYPDLVRPVLREYGECDASDMSEESRHRWDEIAKENSKSCDEFLAARKLYV